MSKPIGMRACSGVLQWLNSNRKMGRGCITTAAAITVHKPAGSSARIRSAGRAGRRTRMLMWVGIRCSLPIHPVCRWRSHTRRFRRRLAGLGRQAVFHSGLTTSLTAQHGRSLHRMHMTRMDRRRQVSPVQRRDSRTRKGGLIGYRILIRVLVVQAMVGRMTRGVCGVQQDRVAERMVTRIGMSKCQVASHPM
jgi:hypothetical protein